MNDPASKERYVSYLLRIWFKLDEGEGAWRASLENPFTGERIGFASPEILFQFLLGATTEGPSLTDVDREKEISG